MKKVEEKMAKAHEGFSLIELMITIAILAILLGIAAPSVRQFILNSRISGATNDLFTDLMLARSEAAKNSRRVFVCPAATQNNTCNGSAWSGTRMILVDADGSGTATTADGDPVKYVNPNLATGTTIAILTGGSGADGVIFKPTGAVVATTTLQVCDGRNGPSGVANAPFLHRKIDIGPNGRAVITPINCQ
jgi:type IV fimbrial biogenesis protein FimT